VWAIVRRIKIWEHERGLVFREGDFLGVLRPGVHWMWDPLRKVRIDVVSTREAWILHSELDLIARSRELRLEARVVDLKDHERAIVRIDGRVDAVLGPGLYALWTVYRKVEVETVDARGVLFEHADLAAISKVRGASEWLEAAVVESGQVGLLFRDGRHEATLAPGAYGLWKGVARARVLTVELREQVLDVAGQEIMTADKVTLRLNAVVTYKIADPLVAVTAVEDYRQALYREAQLVLRAGIGARELDALLAEKEAVARELDEALRGRVAVVGLVVVSLGIRDVILPGEMKELMNKVTEARKASEASLITRREETAAMRSQANTAKILETNPTLMRLRELEVLEKVADKAKLSVVVGEGGLADRVVKLL
jgi:regulator of protease activity HflC (stomatin/prohibitin superfamily)